jgi:hypothetical protein
MKRLFTLFLFTLVLTLSSCYYTAHSFNHGKLLDPGNMVFSVGAGISSQEAASAEFWEYDYSESTSDTGDDYFYSDGEMDPSPYSSGTYTTVPAQNRIWRSISFNYQLGVHEKYPFGGGIEIGLLTEFTYFKTDYGRSTEMLPALDFNVRLGFKDVVTSSAIYQHNVEMGWTIGMWLDNGMFLGYAGGWELEKVIPYVGLRAIYMPTSLMEHLTWMGETDFFEKHDQKFNLRLALGVSMKIRKMKVLPDYIAPEITITGPNGGPNQNVVPNLHIGFRWTNGL